DGITGTAELITHGGAALVGQLAWTSGSDWHVDIVPDSSRDFTPPSALAIDLDHIDGSFGRTDGERTDSLILHDYTLGTTSFDIPLDVANGGFAGTATREDVVLGGITYPTLAVTVATAERSVRLEGTMQTEIGTIIVDNRLRPSRNPAVIGDLEVRATAADLVFTTDNFGFSEFAFTARTTLPRSGCTTIDTGFTGVVRWGNGIPTEPTDSRRHRIENGEITLVCDQAERFRLAFRFRHVYHLDDGRTLVFRGRMPLVYDPDGGTFDVYHAKVSPWTDSVYGVSTTSRAYASALTGGTVLTGRQAVSFWDYGRWRSVTTKAEIRLGLAIYRTSAAREYAEYDGGGGNFVGPPSAGHFQRYGGGFLCHFWDADDDFLCWGGYQVGLDVFGLGT
ncbi:MAG: hypothetical protein ACR2J9_06585, partial [Gaiellales bacterium]